MRDRRRLMFVAGLVLLGTAVARHPTANVSVLTHRAGDPSPHRVQAALDLGLVGVSVLVTWTAERVSR